jgi:glucose/arabinose dehydrogenase
MTPPKSRHAFAPLRATAWLYAAGTALIVWACAGGDSNSDAASTVAGSGVASSATGSGGSSATGATGVGGATTGSGGATGAGAQPSGGSAGTGGSTTGSGGAGTGGQSTGGQSTGGQPSSGGSGGSGGDASTGGAANGGTAGSGGASGTGNGGTGGAASDPYVPCSGTPVPALRLEPVTTAVTDPVFVTSAPNDATDLFIAERGGTVRRLNTGTGAITSFFSVSVSQSGEGGLLGFALHPDFDGEDNTRFFVSYTAGGGGGLTTTVSEYTLASGSPQIVGQPLFTLAQPATNHNGGNIVFGPDGYLYLGLGDGGGSNDTAGNAQNRNTPLGKMLRFDVDDRDTPPPGNLSGSNEDSRVLHYGLRNPWRYSFDRLTGDLYVGDVGQFDWEEISVIPGESANRNLGWAVREGLVECPGCNERGPATPEMLDPVHAWERDPGGAAVGGYVYRGASIPGVYGRYFFADYNKNRVWVLTFQDGEEICDLVEITNDLNQGGVVSSPASFGEDANGEIYMTMLGGDAVYRIEAE